jgi:hypothetical protein
MKGRKLFTISISNFVIFYQIEDLLTIAHFLRRFSKLKKLLWGAVLLIRIRKDPHHFGDLDPHPHQIKIRIRTRIRIRNKIYKLDPEPDPDFVAFKHRGR